MKSMVELHMNDGRLTSINPDKIVSVLENKTSHGSVLLLDGGHKLVVQEGRREVGRILTGGGEERRAKRFDPDAGYVRNYSRYR